MRIRLLSVGFSFFERRASFVSVVQSYVFALVLALALAPAAFANDVPAKKSSWVYFWWGAGQTAMCDLSESAAVAAELAFIDSSTSRCNVTFDSWIGSWPDTEGVTGYHHVCPAPDAPVITWGLQHEEQRNFKYLRSTEPNCFQPPQTEINGLSRHFFYYCENSSYELYTPPNTTVPSCRPKPGEVDVPKQPCNKCKPGGSPVVGDPINSITGTVYLSQTDYRGAGWQPLIFERYYNNQSPASGVLGSNWTHNYDRHLRIRNVSSTATVITAHRENGQEIEFRNFSGNFSVPWTQDVDIVERIAPVGALWKLTTATDSVELYDASGKLLSITSRAGAVTSLGYDAGGRLTSITDPHGRSLEIQYDGMARISTVVLPGSGSYQYAYDGAGNLHTVTAPDSTVRTYEYGPYLTSLKDENNSAYTTWEYDSSSRATATQFANGALRTTVAYNADGSRTITDALGRVTTQGNTVKNGVGKVSTITGAICATCGEYATYNYDSKGNLSEKYDARGTRFANSFSNDGRNLKTAEYRATGTAVSQYTLTSWHASFRIPTSITEPKRTTSFTHDSRGNVLTRTVTDTSVSPNVSRTWTYTYNSDGQVLTEDGPRTDVSNVTTYSYYSCTTGYQCGQLNTITNAAGHVTTYNSYNAHGQPTRITDANGFVTSLAYDARQHLIDRCSGGTLPGCAGGELTHFDYWPTGQLKRVTNPDASYIEYTYDAAHRLTQIQDGALDKIVYTLDAMGNRTAESIYDPSNALRRTHSRIFNTLNQLWMDVNAAGTANVTTVLGYDNNGNQTTTNAPLGRNSTNVYDELNRIKQITDPASGITRFGYDTNGNLTSVADPRNLVTSYSYNGFGDLKTQTSPDTGITTNTYDSVGNLDTSTDSRGAVSDYSYDSLNRVNSVSFTKGGVTDQTISYGYDGGVAQKGRLTSASDANHALAWSYDSRGRVLGKEQTVGGVTLAMGYGYDTAGRMSNVVLPSGSTITYGYNTNGQVTSLTLNGSTSLLSAITYDPFGPITGWTWGNGTFASRGFDTDGKITQVDNANGASLKNYTYDDAFRITGISDAANAALSWTYGYDLLDRLTAASSTGVAQGWTYDANGNRLTQSGTTPSTYTNSGTSNRVNTISGSLARTYGYDNAGNTLSYAGATFTYNNRGRMATASNGGVTATYTYNALGQRVRRATASATTLYVYDEAGHLAGEYTAAGALIQETVWLGDVSVATLRPNGAAGVVAYYVHADHLNTPRLVTDVANNVRWRWDSDPFGATAPNENPSGFGAFQYDLRFPGQQFDAVARLNYNYFRDYDPAIGRYVEVDPLPMNGILDPYRYAESDPVKYRDPFGLQIAIPWVEPLVRPLVRPGGIAIDPVLPIFPTQDDVAECEEDCGKDWSNNMTTCEAIWKMKGRPKSGYVLCKQRANKIYIDCVQGCGGLIARCPGRAATPPTIPVSMNEH